MISLNSIAKFQNYLANVSLKLNPTCLLASQTLVFITRRPFHISINTQLMKQIALKKSSVRSRAWQGR
jgi:hypothetical protein